MLDGSGAQAWGLASGTEVAGFTIEGLLASGSFGTVYRAKQGRRPFALKLVPIDPRGDREVDALRRMRHPNVVGFHGCGVWPEDQPRYLVLAMELVEGRPLDVWVREENPSALQLVSQVLLPLAVTLADVHASGVVHRDIKEANIVVREADGLPVLVDFGAAGLEDAPRLTMRLPPGTPEYRSPEMLRFAREWEGEPCPVGPGDDLWALGVATYGVLTRSLPFGDRNDPELVRAILEKTPPAPHELNPRVPAALGELCMRMLEKAPEDRFADARTLAEALITEWSRADRSWREPLFPEGHREKSPAPVPAPAVPGRPAPGRWWVAALTSAAVLGVVAMMLLVQLSGFLPSPPTHQASSRQEVAPAHVTGDVGRGAAPQTSPTPAPVARATPREDSPMTNPKTIRTLVAAGCVAGSACASGPQLRPPPKPADCPPGAAEAMRKLDIDYGETGAILPPFGEPVRYMPVQEGPITAKPLIIGLHGPLLSLSGRLYIGTDRVYGRFTEFRLPSGEVVPVCMEMSPGYDSPMKRGVPLEEGSTPEHPRIFSSVSVNPVLRFE